MVLHASHVGFLDAIVIQASAQQPIKIPIKRVVSVLSLADRVLSGYKSTRLRLVAVYPDKTIPIVYLTLLPISKLLAI